MPLTLEFILTLVIGLAFGSFATALYWRIPRGIPWLVARPDENAEKLVTRSRCPACRHALTARDLVPLFSWILQKGQCRYCGDPIGKDYPLIELFTLLGCVGIFLTWGVNVQSLIIMAAMPVLAALIWIDKAYMILPNQLLLILFCLFLVFFGSEAVYFGHLSDFTGLFLGSVSGGLLFGLVLWATGAVTGRLLKKEALGFGDVKFSAVAGLWLGSVYLPYYLISAGLLGVFWGILYRRLYKEAVFPFGPALILSFYIGLLLKGAGIIPL